MASLVAGKFSVVTTLSRSVPAIEHNLSRYGLSSRCAKVRASDVPVLELEVPGSNARGKISEEIKRAIRDDRAEAIVLGCRGHGGPCRNAQPRARDRVLDARCCSWRRLCGQALRAWRDLLCLFAYLSHIVSRVPVPRSKSFTGMFHHSRRPHRVGGPYRGHDMRNGLTAQAGMKPDSCEVARPSPTRLSQSLTAQATPSSTGSPCSRLSVAARSAMPAQPSTIASARSSLMARLDLLGYLAAGVGARHFELENRHVTCSHFGAAAGKPVA